MNGKVASDDNDVDDDVDEMPDAEDTVVLTEDIDAYDDDVDLSEEINVDRLVATLESDDTSVFRKKEVRRRLEELQEQRRERQELDSTFNFNLDDDL